MRTWAAMFTGRKRADPTQGSVRGWGVLALVSSGGRYPVLVVTMGSSPVNADHPLLF